MHEGNPSKLIKIGVFYDGQYFFKVSNYYAYQHERKARISIQGLHEYIRELVAESELSDKRFCHIVDSHYFRGRLSAKDAKEENRLYNDRVFDEILMSANVTTHYLPVRHRQDGSREEKGIDVWLALEAYELAFYKRFDVLALIACDGDYVPLVRKLTTLGTRVLLLSWDFEYTSESNQREKTRTAQQLLEEVTYPIDMSAAIDDRVKSKTPLVNSLFIKRNDTKTGDPAKPEPLPGQTEKSTIISLSGGYGFISKPPNNLFFHHSAVENYDFNDLRVGMNVRYSIDIRPDGKVQAANVFVESSE